jgi:hypothetical protein
VNDCKYLTLSQAEKRNPLWKDGYIKVTQRLDKGNAGVFKFIDNGEVKKIAVREEDKYKQIIKGNHVKMDILAEDVIKNLKSVTANRLFSYVRINLEYQCDFVYINIQTAMKHCGVANRSAIYHAIAELKKQKALMPSGQAGYYFINPFQIWKGAYPEKVIEEAKKRQEQYKANKLDEKTRSKDNANTKQGGAADIC